MRGWQLAAVNGRNGKGANMTGMRDVLLAAVAGVSAFAAVPGTAIAHERVVREYHSYTYESDRDDDDDDDWRDHRRYRDEYDYHEPAAYSRSYYYEARPRYDGRYRDNRSYRGDCRTSGTTGAIIGGALGALVGRGLDRDGDRAVGTIVGAGGGAVIGHEIDRKHRC